MTRCACRADEYMEVKQLKSLPPSGSTWDGCSVGRVITLPMAHKARPKLNTHAPSFLKTLKVLDKLLDSPSFKICKIRTLEAPIPPLVL
jgi:hypothetical protein